MRKAILTLEGLPGSPYSPSVKHDAPKKEREDWDAYDTRTWRQHCNTDKEGNVFIPAMGLKQCLDSAAYKLGQKVKGRGVATYKNFFASGLFVENNISITNGKSEKLLTPDDADMVAISANADGRRGSGKRVTRRFPVFHNWRGTAEIVVMDDILTPDVVEHHIKGGGMIVGLGRFRPENGGTNGRFRLVRAEWKEFDFS